MQEKTFKDYCKDAKKRLRNGFWQNYKNDLQEKIDEAKNSGVAESLVKEYYTNKIANDIKSVKEDGDEFYKKVAKVLDEEGEISGAIARFTDFKVYNSLSYEEQQRYNLSLSEKYLKALERYKKEKALKI